MDNEAKKAATDTEWQTFRGSFSFKGKDISGIAVAFHDWCKEIEDRYDCVWLESGQNFNNYWKVDPKRTKD